MGALAPAILKKQAIFGHFSTISIIKDILQQIFLIKQCIVVFLLCIIKKSRGFYVQIWIIDIVFASFSNFRRKNRGGVRGLGYDP